MVELQLMPGFHFSHEERHMMVYIAYAMASLSAPRWLLCTLFLMMAVFVYRHGFFIESLYVNVP